METNKRILLYGNSVILGTLGVRLGSDSQFEVTRVATPMKKTQKLDAVKTDILLFDLGTTRPGAVLSLLESNPALQLIGISPDVNLVKVWSIRELREVSMDHLLQVITSDAKDSPVESGDNEVRLVEAQQTNDQRKGR